MKVAIRASRRWSPSALASPSASWRGSTPARSIKRLRARSGGRGRISMVSSVVSPGLGETARAAERLLEVGRWPRDWLPRAKGLEPRLAKISARPSPTAPRAAAWWASRSTCSARRSGVEPLEGLDDAGVERAPPVMEQPVVRHLVGEGVLEGVVEVGNEPGLVEELRAPAGWARRAHRRAPRGARRWPGAAGGPRPCR